MREKILLPLDGSKVGEAAMPHVENLVTKLLPEPKVEVVLLQVLSISHYVVAGEATARVPYTEGEIDQMKKQATKYLREAAAVLKDKGATTKVKVVIGDAADEILKAADEMNANIIAMSTHGRSGFSRLAFGSVAEKVLRNGNRPVLVVKAPKE
jgi:nucleotide-binding universal stress UspA family protein